MSPDARSGAVLDVSGLPTLGFGLRAPLAWANVGLVLIEGSMFALLLASYLYYAGTVGDWPPIGVVTPGVWLATLGVVLLVVSCLPTHWASKAAHANDTRGVRRNLAANLALSVAFIVIRFVEFGRLGFSWDTHVYGSMVWTILSLHTFHVVSATLETAVFLVLALRADPLPDEQRVGTEVDTIYWFFVVGAWLPFYFLIFVQPHLR
jgi:heme/copper-type cytochrome/quinol oxidase subunit 3